MLPGGWGAVRLCPPLQLHAVPAALLHALGWHGQHERALVLLQPRQHHGSLSFAANKFPVLGTRSEKGGAPIQPSRLWPWWSPGLLPVPESPWPGTGLPVLVLGGAGWAAGNWVPCSLTPEPVASHDVGLALPQGGPKEPPWHWSCRGWSPSCLAITPPGVASRPVLCFLWYCTSLGVTPPGAVPPRVLYCVFMGIVSLSIAFPRVSGVWLSCLLDCCLPVLCRVPCLLGCHFTGYCASSGILPPGISCFGISCRWVLCFLDCCASLCILNLGIMAPWMFCFWVSHPWVLVVLGCHASRDRASLDIVLLGIGSPQASCFWLLCLWVPLGTAPLVLCFWESCWLWCLAGCRAVPGQHWCV